MRIFRNLDANVANIQINSVRSCTISQHRSESNECPRIRLAQSEISKREIRSKTTKRNWSQFIIGLSKVLQIGGLASLIVMCVSGNEK